MITLPVLNVSLQDVIVKRSIVEMRRIQVHKQLFKYLLMRSMIAGTTLEDLKVYASVLVNQYYITKNVIKQRHNTILQNYIDTVHVVYSMMENQLGKFNTILQVLEMADGDDLKSTIIKKNIMEILSITNTVVGKAGDIIS